MGIPIDTIKKLLRLSKSPFPGEAEAAMAKAFEIAARYQIDLDAIDLDDDLRRILHKACRVGRRISHVRRLALGIVNSYWSVTVIISYPDALLVGTAEQVALAEYVLGFLVSSCRAEIKRRKAMLGRGFTARRARSYASGWFYGVASKLKSAVAQISAESQTYAVALRSESLRRDKYVAEQIGRTQVVRHEDSGPRDKAFLMAGYRDGQSVQIRMPMAPQAERLQLEA